MRTVAGVQNSAATLPCRAERSVKEFLQQREPVQIVNGDNQHCSDITVGDNVRYRVFVALRDSGGEHVKVARRLPLPRFC